MQDTYIQKLKSFSPIAYKKGRKSYLFAKQNNRLYRIFFSFSKPSFLVLTPEHIEPMTQEDVFLILSNYTDNNSEMEEKLSYLTTLYKTFKENYLKNDDLNPKELYTKTCELILNHPDFITRYKAENLSSPSQQEISQGQEISQAQEIPQAQKTSQEQETNISSLSQKKPVQVYDFITPPKKTKKSKEEILIPFQTITPQKENISHFDEKNGLLTRTYEGKTFQISLIEPYSFYLVEGDKKTILSIDDFYLFFKNYSKEPQVRDEDTFLLEKRYFEATTSHKKIKKIHSKKHTSKYAVPVSYSPLLNKKNQPTNSIIDTPSSDVTFTKKNNFQPTSVTFPSFVEKNQSATLAESQKEEKQSTPLILSKKRSAKSTTDSMPTSINGNKTDPISEPTIGKLLMKKIVSSISKPPQNETPLSLFLEENDFIDDFNIKIKIQHLKHAIECNALSLKDPQSYHFELEPEISKDGFLHFFSNGVHHILSLDEEKPCFIKKYISSDIQLPIPLDKCKKILHKTLHNNPSLLNEIEKVLDPLYTKLITQQKPRYRSTNHPAFSQIEELRRLESWFEKKEIPQIILPVAINENTIIAKYNQTYLKLCIKNDTPSFAAFENGVTRPMKLAEFTQLNSDIRKTNIYKLIFNNKFSWVKKVFQKQIQTHPEEENPLESKKEDIFQFDLFPTFKQATFGKAKNRDIQPVILSDRSIYAHLSNIDYRIYFSPKYQFLAYEGPFERELYQEELTLILNKLEQTYADELLNHIDLKKHLPSLRTNTPAPIHQQEPQIEKEENLNIEQQNLEHELRSYLYPKKTAKNKLSNFLKTETQLPDFKTHLSILKLKETLSHKNKDNPSTLSSKKSPLFYANNDHIYQKEDEIIYNICLVPGKEYFKRYSLHQSGASLLSLKKTMQILTDATKGNPTLQEKIKKIVPSIYKRYLEEKPTYHPTHTLPNITQLIEKQALLDELNGKNESDILPILTFNNQIFARLSGVYYKILLDNNTPHALAFENNQVRDMQAHEIKKIRTLYQKHHINLFYKNKIVYQSFDQLIHQANENAQQTKNQTSLTKKEEKSIMPSHEEKEINQENQAVTQPKHSPSLILKNKSITKPKKQIPVKKASIDTVEQSEPYQLEPFYEILKTDNTSSPNLLDQIQVPLFFKVHLPDNYREYQSVAKFYHPNKGLPNFNYFFQTLLLLQQIKFQNKKIKHADILNFNFNPTVCSDNVLYFKKGFILSAISLDKNYPYFRIKDLREKMTQRLSWEDTKKIIQYWLGSDERSEQLLNRLAPLYHQNNDKIPPKALPSFQEVFAYHYYKSVLAYLKNPKEGMNSNIPATILHGNQILLRREEIFYKIEADKIIKFEKNILGVNYLMSPIDVHLFLKSATAEHMITPQISNLLRQIYKAEIEPLFYGNAHQNIPIEKRNILISNKNKYLIQKTKSVKTRENT